MTTSPFPLRVVGAAAVAVVFALGATACSSSDDTPGAGSSGGSYSIWDPYPQFTDDSDWVKLLESCGTAAGVAVERTGYDTTDLTNKALLAAQQDNSPDVLIIDNPVISTLAQAGALGRLLRHLLQEGDRLVGHRLVGVVARDVGRAPVARRSGTSTRWSPPRASASSRTRHRPRDLRAGRPAAAPSRRPRSACGRRRRHRAGATSLLGWLEWIAPATLPAALRLPDTRNRERANRYSGSSMRNSRVGESARFVPRCPWPPGSRKAWPARASMGAARRRTRTRWRRRRRNRGGRRCTTPRAAHPARTRRAPSARPPRSRTPSGCRRLVVPRLAVERHAAGGHVGHGPSFVGSVPS